MRWPIATKLGLDIEKLKKDMASPEVEAEIKKSEALAKKMGVNGTPHFLVGDRAIPGRPGRPLRPAREPRHGAAQVRLLLLLISSRKLRPANALFAPGARDPLRLVPGAAARAAFRH